MSSNNFPKGSEWRKWDMHTPCSIVQDYDGNQPEIWEIFITDLEALPEEFRAIDINDYIFLDGYTGASDNPKINKAVVDLLEGTYAVFDTRDLKYKVIPRN